MLAFITSKTFWTIQTKKNLRELLLNKHLLELYDTASPFEAMVDTCIYIAVNKDKKSNYNIKFSDGKKSLSRPEIYNVSSQLFKESLNSTIFLPNNKNLQVYDLYNKKVTELYNNWWGKISDSKRVKKNNTELEKYRSNLKQGDLTLLGMLAEGGVGLQTGNNGKFIGVLKGTKIAERIKVTRIKKFNEAIKKYSIKEYKSIEGKPELEVREIFDNLKEEYGRDILGQGFLFKIIDKNEIADVDKLTKNEKENGVSIGKKAFVPYDKGDREGNRWYLETPYYINWSKENVTFLKSNSGKKGKGMPVFRNPQFYFREGFCWSDIHTVLIKCRLKNKSIHDVKSMSLFSISIKIPEFFIICILNSSFISKYSHNFINATSSFQINDARRLPIIIPSEEQLSIFKNIFGKAVKIKKEQFSDINNKKKETIVKKLEVIQNELDNEVEKLYGLRE